MFRKLLAAFFVLFAISTSSYAANTCPTYPSACPSPDVLNLNVHGIFSYNNVPYIFPSSGYLVGTIDSQTLLNKSIDASEITTGVFNAARLPGPTPGSYGGAYSFSPLPHQFLTSLGLNGSFQAAQPQFGDIGGQLNLSSQVTGNLPPSNLNGGASASSTTFWRGDGVWAVPPGSDGPAGPYSALQFNYQGSLYGTSNATVDTSGNVTASDLYLTGNGAMQLPSGSTSQQPGSPTAGMFRYNSTTGLFEHYSGGAWKNWLDTTGGTLSGALTANGGIALNYTGTVSGSPLNFFYAQYNINDPQTEARPNQTSLFGQLTSADNTQPSLPSISGSYLNPEGYTWGNSSGGAEDSPGYYGLGAMDNSVAWTSGCTTEIGGVPGTCPGVVYWLSGVEGYVLIATGTGGEAVVANEYEGHGASVLARGGEIDTLNLLYDNRGCSNGINAAMCYGFLVSPNASNYNGIGTYTPYAGLHIRGGNSTVTANVYINGTILCLASAPTGAGIIQYATVTGTGITPTHILTAARADIPNGHVCYNIDVSQTAGSASSPVIGASFANVYQPLLVQNYSGGNARIGFTSGGGFLTQDYIDGRYDSTIPIGPYVAFGANLDDEMYMWGPGGNRAGGVAIGFSSLSAITFPNPYAVSIGPSGLNNTGPYYYQNTEGVTCGQGSVIATGGLVTGCGNGQSPQVNIITFTMQAALSSVVPAANGGGSGYTTGETYTPSTGTCPTPPVITVTASGGTATSWAITTAGVCTALPNVPTGLTPVSGVGSGALVVAGFTAIAQTYTPSAGIVYDEVWAQGPGGSAGSGAQLLTSTTGGGGTGGGGGSCNYNLFTAAQLSTTITVQIGVPGLPGLPPTTISTAGNNAGNSSNTYLGSLIRGNVGGPGSGGLINTAVAGGGGAGTANGAIGGGAGGGAAGGIAGGLFTAGANGGAQTAAGEVLAAGLAGTTVGAAGNNGINQTTPNFCKVVGSGAGGGASNPSGPGGNGGNGGIGSGGGAGGAAGNGNLPGYGGQSGPGMLTIAEHYS